MLWYKAWLETRGRFVISILGITSLCSFTVYHQDTDGSSFANSYIYYFILYSAHKILVIMWILAATLLMMGGLLREQALGTSSFTLTLPVGRLRLLAIRVAMGAMQCVGLAVIPWLAMFLIGATVGRTHSITQAIFFVTLLLGGGFVFFSLAVLVSSLIKGEYTAPVVSCGVVLAISVVMDGQRLSFLSPLSFMMGSSFFNPTTFLPSGSFPWLNLILWILLSLSLLVVAAIATQLREF